MENDKCALHVSRNTMSNNIRIRNLNTIVLNKIANINKYKIIKQN